MAEPVGKFLTTLGVLTSRPGAFAIWLIYGVLWVIFDRESMNFHGAAAFATWGMTLLIQRAEHRDTQALQGKLDELLRSSGSARDRLVSLDDKEPEEVEQIREQEKKNP